MTGRAVCISRTEGAGGQALGRLVAERLGFDYVDEEIVVAAAAKGGIDISDVVDEEQRKRALSTLLREIGRSGAIDGYGITGYDSGRVGTPTSDAIRGLILEAIEEMAGRGEVVLVSHAASHALSGREGVLRVLVTASPATRAHRVAESREIDAKQAEKVVKGADAARADYLRRFYGVGEESPTHYDLVVNTDVLELERAADLVVVAAT